MPLQFTPRQTDRQTEPESKPEATMSTELTPAPAASATSTAVAGTSEPSKRGFRLNSGRPLPHVATRVFNTPLCVRPDKAEIILGVLGPRLGLTDIPVLAWQDDDEYDDDIDPGDDPLPYSLENGIATIDIQGVLVKKASGLDALSGLTSYESLAVQIRHAMTNDDVKGVLFNVDSPGGESSGMFDLCDMIHAFRGTKPMISVSNDSMFSAAYAVGSCADKVYITREGGVGSIGCYMLHCNQAGMDKQKGLVYEYIYAGDHKIDGNPHSPLSQSARADLQAEVNYCRDMFVTLVARNRNCTAQQIIDLQARCLSMSSNPGPVPLLADGIGNLDMVKDGLMMQLGIEDEEDGIEDETPTQPEDDFTQPNPANNMTAVITTTQPIQTITSVIVDGITYNVKCLSLSTGGEINGGTITIGADSHCEIGSVLLGVFAGAIPSHKTATTDSPWDGPANEARLKNDQTSSYYRKFYAWQESGSDGTKKSQYKFGHHMVSEGGDIGAANVNACRAIISNLNGARSKPNIPASDQKGVYNHAAKHLRDAGIEPAPLKSEQELHDILSTWEESDRQWVRGIGAGVYTNLRKEGFADFGYEPKVSEQLFGQQNVILAVRRLPECRSSASSSTSTTSDRLVSMLVAPYLGQLSEDLGGFRECYERGCFSAGLSSDPRVLWDHDEKYVLGRQSASTARFWEEADGLHAEADAPDTTWANDLLVSIRRGDVTQSSAAFWILKARWEMRGSTKVRVIEQARLRDASVLSFAAYEATEASASTPASTSSISDHNLNGGGDPAPAAAAFAFQKARLKLLKLR